MSYINTSKSAYLYQFYPTMHLKHTDIYLFHAHIYHYHYTYTITIMIHKYIIWGHLHKIKPMFVIFSHFLQFFLYFVYCIWGVAIKSKPEYISGLPERDFKKTLFFLFTACHGYTPFCFCSFCCCACFSALICIK